MRQYKGKNSVASFGKDCYFFHNPKICSYFCLHWMFKSKKFLQLLQSHLPANGMERQYKQRNHLWQFVRGHRRPRCLHGQQPNSPLSRLRIFLKRRHQQSFQTACLSRSSKTCIWNTPVVGLLNWCAAQSSISGMNWSSVSMRHSAAGIRTKVASF